MQLPRRILLLASVWLLRTGVALGSTVKGKPFPSMLDVTIDDLVKGMESGEFTSVELVKTYLARIAQVNSTLRVMNELNPDALSIAKELDDARVKGKTYGPLHGIPIIIKDNIATKDKMNNTAGSYALLGATVPMDSFIAKKLRQAGAIILGKANLSQWANYRSSNSSNGWTAIGGQVHGAYYPGMDPSGSSSGSAVSSSIGLALAALGTETDGSILSPSELASLVGIKPTVGLTSRHLVIPISQHQDTVGPLARTVKDAAIILGAIAGVDPNDNYTSAIPNKGKIPDYLAACKPNSLKGARLGIPYNVLETKPSAILTAFNNAVKIMKAAGAEIVEANFTKPNAPQSNDVLEADFISGLPAYVDLLTYNPHNIKTVKDLQQFTQHFPLEQYPNRNTEVWDEALALGFGNTDPRFWPAYQENLRAAGEYGLLGAIERNKLDALIIPTAQSPGLAAPVGAPGVTVPLGYAPGNTTITRSSRGLVETAPNIPFGLSFLGNKFTEEKLISLAYAFEQKTLVRDKVLPYIVPNIELGDFAGF